MKNICSQLSNAAAINLQHFSPLFLHFHAFPQCQCKDSRMGLWMCSVVQAWEAEGTSKDSGLVKITRWRALFLVLDMANENSQTSFNTKKNKQEYSKGSNSSYPNQQSDYTHKLEPAKTALILASTSDLHTTLLYCAFLQKQGQHLYGRIHSMNWNINLLIF